MFTSLRIRQTEPKPMNTVLSVPAILNDKVYKLSLFVPVQPHYRYRLSAYLIDEWYKTHNGVPTVPLRLVAQQLRASLELESAVPYLTRRAFERIARGLDLNTDVLELALEYPSLLLAMISADYIGENSSFPIRHDDMSVLRTGVMIQFASAWKSEAYALSYRFNKLLSPYHVINEVAELHR